MQNKAGQHVLVLRQTDIDHVIQFSDRPYRIVKYITGKDLAANWSVGEDSFKVDPPNAVLITAQGKAEIVILTSINVGQSRVSFTLKHKSMIETGMESTYWLGHTTVVISQKR